MRAAFVCIVTFCALIGTCIYCGVVQRDPDFSVDEYVYANFTYDRYAIHTTGCGRNDWYNTPPTLSNTSIIESLCESYELLCKYIFNQTGHTPRLFKGSKRRPRVCRTSTSYNIILKHEQYECSLWPDAKDSDRDGPRTRDWIIGAHPLGTRRDLFYYFSERRCSDELETHIRPWAIAIIVICTVAATYVPCLLCCLFERQCEQTAKTTPIEPTPTADAPNVIIQS